MLFSENGFKGTSVRSINRRVGLADGILYHYFPGGKKELFRTIVTESFQKIQNEVTTNHEHLTKGDIPFDRFFTEAFKLFSKTVNDNIDIIRIIVKENDVQEFISTENILSIIGCNKKCISDYLKKLAENGEIKEIDFNTAASTIVGAFVNYIMLKVMNIDAAEIVNEKSVRKTAEYYMNLWKNK